jgi:hypothetical protein
MFANEKRSIQLLKNSMIALTPDQQILTDAENGVKLNDVENFQIDQATNRIIDNRDYQEDLYNFLLKYLRNPDHVMKVSNDNEITPEQKESTCYELENYC